MAYFQYRQKCQYFTYNRDDNKPSLMESIPILVFTFEMAHFDED